MVQTYSCDVQDCGKVFTRAYELRKHKATHENPESVFHCPECDFITLAKKSLVVHIAQHTGEKPHKCRELVTSPGEPPVPCDYRTNDPAALSKHRKRIHGHVPLQNCAGPRKPLEAKDDNQDQPRRSPRGHTPPSPRPKVTRTPRAPKNPKGANVTNPSPLRNEITDVDAMAVDGDDALDADMSGTALDDWEEEEEMSFNSPFDPTLSSSWMAKYESTYTTFEPYVPKSPTKASSEVPDGFDMDMRREGCLCPEWMEEAGVEGWGKSAVEDEQEMQVL